MMWKSASVWFVIFPLSTLSRARLVSSLTSNNQTTRDDVERGIILPSCSETCHQSNNSSYGDETSSKLLLNQSSVEVLTACVSHENVCFKIENRVCVLDLKIIRNLRFLSETLSFEFFTSRKLRILYLKDMDLRCIEKVTDDRFFSINALTLNHNHLTNISIIENFGNFTMYYLDLSFNQFDSLHQEAFRFATDLIWLNLHHNNIKTITPKTFQNLQRLQFLDLSSNHLCYRGLSEGSFDGLYNLRSLSLADNVQIHALPKFNSIGLQQTKLEILDLHGLTCLDYIKENTFQSLNFLKVLNLSACRLSDLADGWLNGGPEKTLNDLDLSGNKFVRIKPNYFVSFELKEQNLVDLSGLDSRNFSHVTSLSGTSSDDNSMHFNYTKIRMSCRKLFYKPLSNLTKISLRDNSLLQQLDDDSFSNLPNLQHLSLKNCKITKLKIATSKFRFQKNAISKSFQKLRELLVEGNPLDCDCYVRAFLDFYFSQKRVCQRLIRTAEFKSTSCYQMNNIDKTLCLLPRYTHGILISTVSPSLLYCPDEPFSMLVIMLIGPITFVAAIGIMLICGYFAVSLSRNKRYKSGFNHTQSYPQRNQAEKQLETLVLRKIKTPNHSYSATPRSSTRFNYRTNLVLGKMGTPHTPKLQTSILPSSLLGSFSRLDRSRSPSPSPRFRRKEKFKLSNQASSATVANCSGVQLSLLSKNSPKISPVSSKRLAKSLKTLPLSCKRSKLDQENHLNDETKPFLLPGDENVFEETLFSGKTSSGLNEEGKLFSTNKRNK